MANRYWVGGTGTWDTTSTTNWSATSGGVGGASVPTSTDYVTINASSGGGTITLAQDVTIQGIDLRGFTGTFHFSTFVINSAGSATISPRMDATCTVSGTKTVNLTYSGSTGARSYTLVGVSASNALNINVTAGSDTINGGTNEVFNNLNFTGFSGTLSNFARTIYGNLTISSGMTMTAGANAMTFAATSGTQQITTNGKTLDFPIIQNSPGATLQLQDNLTMGSTRTFTLTAGTLDLVSRTLSAGAFSSSNNNVRAITFGTGNITVTGSGLTVFNITNGGQFLTLTGSKNVFATYAGSVGNRTFNGSLASVSNPNNTFNIFVANGADNVIFRYNFLSVDFTGFAGTIQNTQPFVLWQNLTIPAGVTHISDPSNFFIAFMCPTTATIITNGITFNCPISFGFNTSQTITTGTYAFQDALNQNSAYDTTIYGGTVQLKAGVTSTVGAFATSGTNQKFLQSTTPGSQATLAQASGTVTAQYLTIRDINATGGATWNAFVDQGNIDAGNNDGWDFGISPIVGGNEYTYQLRSFTQPRRF